MISSVIIILQEVLEAMLLISILMASSSAIGLNQKWLPAALLTGLAGAVVYALFFERVSMMFEGFGQEYFYSAMMLGIAILLGIWNLCLVYFIRRKGLLLPRPLLLGLLLMTVSLAMMHEGAEIYLYGYAYGVAANSIGTIFSGGAIGAGIGISVGTFIYYGLRALQPINCLRVGSVVLTLVSAGMILQASLRLTQADVLPAQMPLWDSSFLISENSIVGELFYALLGYEATPTPLQVMIYGSSLFLMIMLMVLVHRTAGKRESQ
ncbi:MAG: hypothetical protein RQ757_00550 [Pseudomonadales bacterium]|nr:hypothetical protein [Pseudomonadales bacterium]